MKNFLIVIPLFSLFYSLSVFSQISLPETFMKTWPELEEQNGSEPLGFYHFRGNPSRSWYGVGSLPSSRPKVLWRHGPFRGYYNSRMTQASVAAGQKKIWTGTGWTGQPVLRTLDDGREEVIVGAYDQAIHFFDANSGERTRNKFQAGGIIKGTVSLDPSGDPILLAGPNDGHFRVIDISRSQPTEIYRESFNTEKIARNRSGWDSSPMFIGDYIFAGGENALFYTLKMHKKRDTEGNRVDVKVEKLNAVRVYTRKMMSDFGSDSTHGTSIESSPVFFEDRVYISNSGGLIQGFDVNLLVSGASRNEALVFEHWVGDDVDATIVADEHGHLYVSIQDEKRTTKAQILASKKNGHLVKLNPYDPIHPILATFTIPNAHKTADKDGFWATPSINKTHIYITAHNGRFYVLDRNNLEIIFSEDLGSHNWATSVLIEDKLLVPTCIPGSLVLYDVSKPEAPQKLWTYKHPSGCIESTPLVWKGNIYVGSRDGYFYKIGL